MRQNNLQVLQGDLIYPELLINFYIRHANVYKSAEVYVVHINVLHITYLIIKTQ